MKAYKCDRCRKFYEGYDYQRTLRFSIADYSSTCGRRLDLCPTCNDELQEWIAKGEEQTVSIEKEPR